MAWPLKVDSSVLWQVGADITRLQEDAKGIKERLKHEHSEHKSVQTTKILSNFEARPF